MRSGGLRTAAVALAAAAALAALWALMGEGRPARPPHSRATPARAPEARWRDVLEDRFAVLRRHATAADRMPPALLRSPLLAGVPVEALGARRLSSVRPAWIVPTADRQVCVVAWSTVSCARARSLLRDGAAPGVSWRAAQGVTISGVAGDGVASIVVRYRREAVTIPVVENYFAIHGWRIPTSIEWRGPHGMARFSLPAAVSSQHVSRVPAPGATARQPETR